MGKGSKGSIRSYSNFDSGKGAGKVSGCYCCGAPGHQKNDCPSKEKTCDLCGKSGHLKSMCDNAGGGLGGTMAKGGSKGSSKSGSCYCCGQTGHQKFDCPSKGKTCENCGKIGHLKFMCELA